MSKFSIEQCQEAMARIAGFHRWSDVTDIAIKTGADRSTPFWHLLSRNDDHAKILSAILRLQIDPIGKHVPGFVILGKPDDVAATSICLWSEVISATKKPGLILISTDKKTIQDTAIGTASEKLGLSEAFSQFRVIDAREKTLPVSISANPSQWVNALTSLLSEKDGAFFESSGGEHLLRRVIHSYAEIKRWGNYVPFDIVDKAVRLLRNYKQLGPRLIELLRDDNIDCTGLIMDIDNYAEQIPAFVLDAISTVIDEANSRFSAGVCLGPESEHRPTVVLFSKENLPSLLVAGVVFRMISDRTPAGWERNVGYEPNPILYFNDTSSMNLPRFMQWHSENMLIANGSLSRDGLEFKSSAERSLFSKVENGFLTFSGKKEPV